LAIREKLPLFRRQEAARQLQAHLFYLLPSFDRVASFCSFQHEIDLSSFNEACAKQGRLLLPRMHESTLQYYRVDNLDQQMEKRSCLLKPNIKCCVLAELTAKDLILVPALAFDSDRFRLGYGKGCYDRLLQKHNGFYSLGIGFLEQLNTVSLPRDPWDQPVSELLLF